MSLENPFGELPLGGQCTAPSLLFLPVLLTTRCFRTMNFRIISAQWGAHSCRPRETGLHWGNGRYSHLWSSQIVLRLKKSPAEFLELFLLSFSDTVLFDEFEYVEWMFNVTELKIYLQWGRTLKTEGLWTVSKDAHEHSHPYSCTASVGTLICNRSTDSRRISHRNMTLRSRGIICLLKCLLSLPGLTYWACFVSSHLASGFSKVDISEETLCCKLHGLWDTTLFLLKD